MNIETKVQTVLDAVSEEFTTAKAKGEVATDQRKLQSLSFSAIWQILAEAVAETKKNQKEFVGALTGGINKNPQYRKGKKVNATLRAMTTVLNYQADQGVSFHDANGALKTWKTASGDYRAAKQTIFQKGWKALEESMRVAFKERDSDALDMLHSFNYLLEHGIGRDVLIAYLKTQQKDAA